MIPLADLVLYSFASSDLYSVAVPVVVVLPLPPSAAVPSSPPVVWDSCLGVFSPLFLADPRHPFNKELQTRVCSCGHCVHAFRDRAGVIGRNPSRNSLITSPPLSHHFPVTCSLGRSSARSAGRVSATHPPALGSFLPFFRRNLRTRSIKSSKQESPCVSLCSCLQGHGGGNKDHSQFTLTENALPTH